MWIVLKFAGSIGAALLALAVALVLGDTKDASKQERRRKLGRVLTVLAGVCGVAAAAGAAVDEHQKNTDAETAATNMQGVQRELAENRERCARQEKVCQQRLTACEKKDSTCAEQVALLEKLIPEVKSGDCARALGVLLKAEASTATIRKAIKDICQAPGPPTEPDFGVAQLRVATEVTEKAARARRGQLLTLFTQKGLKEWRTKVVERPISSHWNGREVWLVVLNQVLPSEKERMCTWLKCNGYAAGHAPCEIRGQDSGPR